MWATTRTTEPLFAQPTLLTRPSCVCQILVHPVFWYDVPATLKAFLEQVLTAGFAYKNLPLHPILVFTLNICQFIPGLRGFLRAYGSQGLLRDKKVIICRTTGGPKAGMRVSECEQATNTHHPVLFDVCRWRVVCRCMGTTKL